MKKILLVFLLLTAISFAQEHRFYGTVIIDTLIVSDSLKTNGIMIGEDNFIDSTSISADSLFFWIGGNKYKAVKSSFPYWILLGLPFLLLRRRKL